MPSPITYVCLAIIVGSLGVAKAIGITVPRVWAPFDKEFAIIVGVQFVTLWFSSNIAIAVTVQPEQREGDVDGILDAKLLEYDTLENQMIIAMTTTFAAAMLILGHVCCPAGHWQAASGDGVPMLVTGLVGELLIFAGSIPCESSHRGRAGRARSRAEPVFPSSRLHWRRRDHQEEEERDQRDACCPLPWMGGRR